MCCILSLLLFIGPRIAGFAWYLIDPGRWSAAFSNILWPILGIIFVPWTTMAYVLVSPNGVSGLEWAVVGIGFLIDLGVLGGGGYSRNKRD
ncbi:MAG: hypothetical protein KBF17_14320 [Candidatus Promineofilum sp.]|nr:hypothetical protein [Promineifilum sp.]